MNVKHGRKNYEYFLSQKEISVILVTIILLITVYTQQAYLLINDNPLVEIVFEMNGKIEKSSHILKILVLIGGGPLVPYQ